MLKKEKKEGEKKKRGKKGEGQKEKKSEMKGINENGGGPIAARAPSDIVHVLRAIA